MMLDGCSIPYAYFVPCAYGTYHTRTVRFSVPYGIGIRVWYVPYTYYAFSQCLIALRSPSYNGLSLQASLAEQTQNTIIIICLLLSCNYKFIHQHAHVAHAFYPFNSHYSPILMCLNLMYMISLCLQNFT